MKTKKLIFLFSFLVLCLSGPIALLAQPDDTRPTVGLVLSGGGAKGFAHVPVLRMIDSLGIPIDYVAGTSMGALLGGFYAIGYNPEQMEEMILEEDWMDMLDDAPLRRNVPILEKDVQQKRLASVGIKTLRKPEEENKVEVLFPQAYLAGQEVFDKILELTIGFHDEQNFLSLPKGFLCVAADLKSGREVVLTSGSLPHALRSTMSIPTMFSPNNYDGMMLVDGGAVNNLPSNHLRALGCDIIIGINVSAPFSRVGENPSMAEILGQIGMITDSESSELRKSLCDVLIEPDVFEYGVTSFGAKKDILKRGYDAAQKALPELQKIAERLRPGGTFPGEYGFHFPDSIVLTGVSFAGMEQLSEQYLASKFDVPVGQKTTYAFLDQKNKELYGTGKVVQCHFFLYRTNQPWHYHCELVIEEKKAETTIGVGLHYNSDLKAGILLSGEMDNFPFKGSRLLTNFVISERPRFDFNYLLDAGRPFSLGVDANLRLFNNSLYQDRAFIGRYQHFDKYASVYALQTIENSAVLKIGLALNHSSYNIEDVPVGVFLDSIGINQDMEFDYFHYGPFLDLTVDRLDNLFVPEKGVFASIRGQLIMLSDHSTFSEVVDKAFITTTARWKNVWPVGKRFDVITDFNAGVNLFNRPSPTYFHILGGAGDYFFNNQKPFLGYRYQELFLRQFYGYGAFDFRYRVMPRVYGSLTVNAGIYNENWDDYTQFGLLEGWGVKAIWLSPFGPVSGTLHSTFKSPELMGYLSIGFVF